LEIAQSRYMVGLELLRTHSISREAQIHA